MNHLFFLCDVRRKEKHQPPLFRIGSANLFKPMQHNQNSINQQTSNIIAALFSISPFLFIALTASCYHSHHNLTLKSLFATSKNVPHTSHEGRLAQDDARSNCCCPSGRRSASSNQEARAYCAWQSPEERPCPCRGCY